MELGVIWKGLGSKKSGPGSFPGLARTISDWEIGFLLLPSRDMAEIIAKVT